MRRNIRSDMVLKACLSRCPPEMQRELERFLPEGERLVLETLPRITAPELGDSINEDLLERVHWSWFLPTLKTYTHNDQQNFLAGFTTNTAKNLAKVLEISFELVPLSPIAQLYFRQILLDSLLGPTHWLLPLAYLPQTPLRPLLNRSKKELVELIDRLSLYDLAYELRQIVETRILKKIYNFLSEEERHFLRAVAAHKEALSPARMGLEKWDGSEESLRVLLHRRGIMRLGIALSGQDPDFVWYVCHQLDIGRGNTLFKYCAKDPVHGISDIIVRQIEELIR